ncbi:hypothetical protein [Streptomyces sp. ME19-01-6]|uniref:hypothetical protein n=1 Tax=Streptomyces sp. ME19-01-6 TaxID=3028686 RepID=UPI0029A8D03F|nr:hypothetical protein [Streptomyces sp. ME19-01-6]MDX3228412.1 hypothetical protein [Streptomyces sp. ME19-01-6]
MERSASPVPVSADGIGGDVSGEREKGNGDDAQGGLLAGLTHGVVAGGELPGDRGGGGDFDDGIEAEADQRGGGANVRMRQATASEAHGRGLCPVNALAHSWRAGPSRFGGTVVSFVLADAWSS